LIAPRTDAAAEAELTPPALPEDRLGDWRRAFFGTRTPAVSVCIANWNCQELLRQCLESLHGSDQGVPFETIVVDNASSDGSAAMIAEAFPQVQVICNSTNLGFSRANNQAARRASGRFLFFLNNDTVLPPGTLGRLAAFLDAHPEVGMIGPRLRDPRGRVQVSFRPQPTVWSLLHRTTLLRWSGLCRDSYRRFRRAELESMEPRSVEVLMGAAVLISRRLFDTVGGWDEDFDFGGEDMELSHRVRRRAPLMHVPSVEITHFGRSSTRRNIAFAAPRIAAGFVRCLRKTGSATEAELLVYKTLVSLDAPLQFMVKLGQYILRTLGGRNLKAAKSLVEVRTRWNFLRHGLIAFWRA